MLRELVHACLCEGVGFDILPPFLSPPHTRGWVYGKQQHVHLLWLSVRPYVLRDFVHACLCKGVGFYILPPILSPPHARGWVYVKQQRVRLWWFYVLPYVKRIDGLHPSVLLCPSWIS